VTSPSDDSEGGHHAYDADKAYEAQKAYEAYQTMGGETKVRAVLRTLYDRLFADPMVGFLFEGKDKDHIVAQQTAFTCRFLGDSQPYQGKPLPEAHAALPLLAGHFDRRHKLLEEALEEHRVPAPVKLAWLRIDAALRTSVLCSGEDARTRTREA
jgi:hemoglobin